MSGHAPKAYVIITPIMNFQVHHWSERVSHAYEEMKTWLASLVTHYHAAWVRYLRSKAPYLPYSLPQRRSKVVESILSDIHFQETLETFVSSSGLSILEVEKKARSYLMEISSDLSYFSFPLWNKILAWVFKQFYEDIEVNKGGLESIKQLAGKKPIVFVPNHRSHMDYLLVSYLLYNERLPMPYICAGINLSFWPMGTIFRKSGAFFIRRSFEGNNLYKKSLEAYLHYLLKKQSFIEFFIEGSRSRTGKLIPAKKGIVSLLLQNYLEGGLEDVILMPMSIVYQSVIEEKSYLDEQQGAAKSQEKFSDLFKLRKLFQRKYGKVYVRFDEPLSIKDFIASRPTADVDVLANAITYGINRSTVVTPTSLVSQALLTHPRKILLKKEIEEHVRESLEYLRYKGSPLSNCLQNQWNKTIDETLSNLTHSRQLLHYRDEEGTFYVVPQKQTTALDYNKNTSIHFFVSLSALASILLQSRSHNNSIDFPTVEEHYQFIKDIFCREFIFSLRHSLRDHLTNILEYLKQRHWITIDGDRILLKEEGLNPLQSFQRILQSYYEAYYAVWRVLRHLQGKTTERVETERYLLNRVHLQFLRDVIQHPESINKNLVQNALAAFIHLGLVQSEHRGIGRQKKTYYHFSFDTPSYDSIGHRLLSLIPALSSPKN